MPQIPNYVCDDGLTNAGLGACELQDTGKCGWTILECPDTCTPEDCGPMPQAPNYLCDDGVTTAGPGACKSKIPANVVGQWCNAQTRVRRESRSQRDVTPAFAQNPASRAKLNALFWIVDVPQTQTARMALQAPTVAALRSSLLR